MMVTLLRFVATLAAWGIFANTRSSFGVDAASYLEEKNYTSSQSVEDYWSLEINETAGTRDENNTFVFVYYVSLNMTDANTAGAVFQQDCSTPPTDITNVDTMISDDTPGEAYLTFDMDVFNIIKNPNITTNIPGQQKGTMLLCSRMSLQTEDAAYEVNFIENIITINYEFSGNFSVTFEVTPKSEFFGTELNYTVDAYLCDPSAPDIPLAQGEGNTQNPYYPGSVVTICVTPAQESIDDGLHMKSIDEFQWYRGDTEQPAVVNGAESSDFLSILTCDQMTLYCWVSSVLWAAFFQTTQAPTSQPVEVEPVGERRLGGGEDGALPPPPTRRDLQDEVTYLQVSGKGRATLMWPPFEEERRRLADGSYEEGRGRGLQQQLEETKAVLPEVQATLVPIEDLVGNDDGPVQIFDLQTAGGSCWSSTSLLILAATTTVAVVVAAFPIS